MEKEIDFLIGILKDTHFWRDPEVKKAFQNSYNLFITEVRKSMIRKGLKLPVMLENYCRKCGSYFNLSSNNTGFYCLDCMSNFDVKPTGKKIKVYLYLCENNDKGKVVKKNLSTITGSVETDFSIPFTKIAKIHNCIKFWKNDNYALHGYYINEKYDKAVVASKERLVIGSFIEKWSV